MEFDVSLGVTILARPVWTRVRRKHYYREIKEEEHGTSTLIIPSLSKGEF